MLRPWRAPLAFGVLFVLYQSAEGVGARWLRDVVVQDGLMIASVLAAWPLSRWLGWKGYGAYALRWAPVRVWFWLAGGLGLAVAGKALAVAVGLRLGVYASDSGGLVWNGFSAGALAMLLVGTFVPSLAEDILTRGFWYRAAGVHWRRGLVFVAFSSLMYVLNHIYRLERGPLEWAMLFCFGLAYATALWRSGTLWAAVGLHWGWNLANGLLAVDTLDPRRGAALSAIAHLGILLVVLVLPVRRLDV
ncbi:MAG TPA: CPBP family intramembrane glutamic endopeptidase [Frateuria sp.]|uniref:CPBP family intramembrane glutamic endopeptidase n=1 Tax=Frateuria sp. TaxID=2211372 RepID=UPI002DEB831C|nr:CPBP family intramembrane glutamic endopeptidase [Frateuria sp.]